MSFRDRSRGAAAGMVAGAMLFVAAGAPAAAEETQPIPSGAVTPPPRNPSRTATPSASASSERPAGLPPQAPPPATPVPTTGLKAMDSVSCKYFNYTPAVDAVPANPWHLQRLRMDEVWQQSTGKGVKVVVIDTAASLAGTPYLPKDRFSTYTVVNDTQEDRAGYDCEHGTNVAALIGAERVAGMQSNFAGIAPDAEVITIRALHSSTANQPLDETVAALREATKIPGVRIINISQNSGVDRSDYAEAIRAAQDKGIIVVAAAGNRTALEGAPAAWPAAYPGVISVGMTAPDDSVAPNSFSSIYEDVTIGAPGVDMVSISPSPPDWQPGTPADTQIYRFRNVGTPPGGAQEFSGTSFAAPIVTGVVALMLEQADEQGITLNADQVASLLRETADPPTSSIPDPQIGWGIVNPMRALAGVRTGTPGAEPSRLMDPANYPQQPPIDHKARLISVGSGIVLASLVALGIGLAIAIPAARKRGGKPADPPKN